MNEKTDKKFKHKKIIEKIIFWINFSIFILSSIYFVYNKFENKIIISLTLALLLINLYTWVRKDYDTNKNSILYAETMAHSFLSGVLIIIITNLFKNNFSFNYIYLLPLLGAIVLVLAINLEKYLYDNEVKIQENLFFFSIELAMFNLIPAYLISYFIEDSIQKNTNEFFIGIAFIFGFMIVFFIIKKALHFFKIKK